MHGSLPSAAAAGGPRRARTAAWLLAAAAAAALAAVAGPAAAQATHPSARSAGSADAASTASTPIKHVIEIMIENHSFDNLFGSFPGADGIPSTRVVPEPQRVLRLGAERVPGLGHAQRGRCAGRDQQLGSPSRWPWTTCPARATRWTTTPFSRRTGCPRSPSSARSSTPTSSTWRRTSSWPTTTSSRSIAPTQPNVMTALNGTAHGWVLQQPGARLHAAVELDLRRADRARPHVEDLLRAAHVDPRPARSGTRSSRPADTADLTTGASSSPTWPTAPCPTSPSSGRASATAPSHPRTSARATPGSASW